MYDHVRRNRRRQAEIVRGGEAVDEHADLVASGKGINYLAIVGNRRSLRQIVEPRRVVQTSVDASKLPCQNKTLKGLIDGVSAAKVEEVDRRPHLSRWGARDSICDRLLEVRHSSDICTQSSDKCNS
jgi:hypothetical protein